MPAWEITTLEYDVPVERLLNRRLGEDGEGFSLDVLPDGARVHLRGGKAAERLAEAVTKILLRDLQYFVLAHMTDSMPLSLGEKRTVLTDALYAARMHEETTAIQTALTAFFQTERALCLDGFLHFRMQEVLMLWQLCVEQAASKVLLQKEYGELMQALQSYVRSRAARMEELRLCIHEDGSCTLSDNDQLEIEYADSSPDGIVTLLVNMAPRRLIIYDKSGGTQQHLCDTLLEVFSGRVVMKKG